LRRFGGIKSGGEKSNEAMSGGWHELFSKNRLLPFLSWLKGYGLPDFRADLVAGLTVGVILIPQAMAYAMLAGMPAVYGLYAAAVTPIIAGLWGSLRQLATGPIAIMSLLVLTTLSPLAEPGSSQYVELAFVLALMVGGIYLTIGLLRLGLVMAFISHSAVKGFTSAAALIIISTQLPHFLGISTERHEFIVPLAVDIIGQIPLVHVPTVLLGLLALAIIIVIKKYKPNFPGALVALIATTLTVVGLDFFRDGVAVVGVVQGGLPYPHVPKVSFQLISSLLGSAVVIGMVSFAETYSVGKAISAETKQKVDVDQEFLGQGMANFFGSFFQCYPVAGSFSRSAINNATGAKTGVSSVLTGLSVIITLLFLTPFLHYIPRAALAALVIHAVFTLFHPKDVLRLWKMNRHDGMVAITVFVLALVSKPDYALLIGVLMSLMLYLWKTIHPRIDRIAKDPDRDLFINADLFEKPSCPQILQLRPDHSIYFANAQYVCDHILCRVKEQQTPVKFLLLDFQGISFIDMTGIDEMELLMEDLAGMGILVRMTYVHHGVYQALERAGFVRAWGVELIVESKGEAIKSMFAQVDHAYCKKACPYKIYQECESVK